jgi:hypothetical protein
MTGSPWILKTFQIDQTGSTGAYIYIEARKPGIIAFILNLLGLDPTAELKVTKGAVSFRSTSLSGMTETSTSLTQIGAFQGGHSKPIGFLIFAFCFLTFSAYIDIMFESLVMIWFGLIVSIGCLIAYALQKYLAFGFETSGGSYYGMSFKRGVLNNVSVDITQVEHALQLVNALIGSASLGENYSLSDKVHKVASQVTIVAAQPPQQHSQMQDQQHSQIQDQQHSQIQDQQHSQMQNQQHSQMQNQQQTTDFTPSLQPSSPPPSSPPPSSPPPSSPPPSEPPQY